MRAVGDGATLMDITPKTTTYIGGREVRVGQTWQRSVHYLQLQLSATCVAVSPDRFVGRVLLGGTEVLRVDQPASTPDEAERLAELLLVSRVVDLLSGTTPPRDRDTEDE